MAQKLDRNHKPTERRGGIDMHYSKRSDAQLEATKRTRLGYPHYVAEVTQHSNTCLYSTDHEIPYRCTCGNSVVIGWSLVLGRK